MKLMKDMFLPNVCLSKRKHLVCIASEENPWTNAVHSGLVSRIRHESHKQLDGGLHKLQLSFVSVSNDEECLRKKIDKAVADKAEGLITVGAWCSKKSAEIISHEKYDLPHFFCGVKDPKALNLDQKPGVTGGVLNHRERVNALFSLSSSIKKVVFIRVTYPGTNQDIAEFISLVRDDMDQDRSALKIAFEERGISTIETPLDLTKPIESQLVKADVICVFREVTRFNYLTDLIQFATKHKIPLYAAEKESVLQGAALGYGDSGYDYGYQLGQMVYEYLSEQVEYTEIKPLVFDSPGTLHINSKALKSQGVNISTERLSQLTDSIL